MKKIRIKDRPAGSGIIKADSVPSRRGIWDLYVTSQPSIGMFDVAIWLEYSSEYSPSDEVKQKALDEIAAFIRDNVKNNVIMLEFSHKRIMGGFGSGEQAGRNFLERDDVSDLALTDGYELRLTNKDAVTFLALWQGFENSNG